MLSPNFYGTTCNHTIIYQASLGVFVVIYLNLISWRPGADCSKLTTTLVNVTLKFIKCKHYKYANIFCWKNVRIFCTAKDSHIFATKNNSVFDNIVHIHLTSSLNDALRLTML